MHQTSYQNKSQNTTKNNEIKCNSRKQLLRNYAKHLPPQDLDPNVCQHDSVIFYKKIYCKLKIVR